ncbi:MAG: zinc-dependent peptidase [Jejuia sp.]
MLIENQTTFSFIGNLILVILLCFVVVLVFLLLRKIVGTILDGIEMIYARFTKRPILVHFYLVKSALNKSNRLVLEKESSFYNKLERREQRFFRHRVATFIKKTNFEGREGFTITEDVKVRIAIVAIMLTFGFRNYLIKYLKHIVVYPTTYYSRFSKSENKGEFNARSKTVVLSWDNFIEGNKIDNDRLNLGIHEFAHAIHFNSIKNEDINSILFIDTFNELRDLLSSNDRLKQKLATSGLIRNYAFTNDSELLAVILETFIEAPTTFKLQFPNIYSMVKQMLNYHFKGY